MAKGRAVESSEQCTHAKAGKQVPRKSVSSTLLELTEKAKRERKYRFRSLYREIDLRMLYDSFMLLKPSAAARHTIYRALNSRSQKKSYSWQGFTAMWKTLDIPNPKIIEKMRPSFPCLIH
jgi:hypothetical protein